MYLLDTHTLLWAIGEPHRLSAAARAAVESGQAKVSVIALWELLAEQLWLITADETLSRYDIETVW